jgi:type III secretion protein V
VLELADDLAALARVEPGRAALASVRDALWRDLGVRIPTIAVRAGRSIPGCWTLHLDEIPIASGRAPAGEATALASPEDLALVGIPFTSAPDPRGGAFAVVAASDAGRARSLGTVLGPLDRALWDASAALARSAHELVGVQEVQALLDELEPSSPALVRETARQLPPALLAEVLRRLVEEGVSIRPLRTILEAALEAGGGTRPAAELAESCRRALRRHIAHRSGGGGALQAVLLDPAAEQAVREALLGEVAALDPAVARALLDALDAELREIHGTPVLLTSADVRRAARALVAQRFPRMAVLAYGELPPETPIRPVGRVALAA